eukprot:c30323_g1_i1 orf=117-959(-)
MGDWDTWDWHDESFKLDFHVSEGMTRSFWDELPGSTPFFDSTPILGITHTSAALSAEDSQESNAAISSLEPSDDSCISNKSRRMLLFSETNFDLNTSDDEVPFDPFLEKFDSSPISSHETETFLVADLTSTESLGSICGDPYSSLQENMVRSSENSVNRMSAFPAMSDSDKAQEVVQRSIIPILTETSTPGKFERFSRKRKLATPVAYPFAVLKPSNVEGAVTLEDINQRILLPLSEPRECYNNCEARASGIGFSGKSIVGLTKIHTEGNGSITIIRTKC